MDKEILYFIKQFQLFPGYEDTFLCGCCYWFAHILATRFHGEIFYEPIEGHFITKISDQLFDITGNVTSRYSKIFPWDTYILFESSQAARITRGCILKLPPQKGE